MKFRLKINSNRTKVRFVISMTFLVYMLTWCTKNVDSSITVSKKASGDCRNPKSPKSCNITKLLADILKGYDKRLRPFLNDRKPVTITVGIWILSIDSINVMDMDYRIDLFFRQSWTDPRLSNSYPEPLTVSNSMLDKIWVPDTYFENSKSSNFHFVTVPNKMLRIHQNGTVMYNSRISLRASCPMNLRYFPVDSQHCHLHIESYGYDDKHIKFKWEDRKERVSIGKKVKNLPQYNLTDFKTNFSTSKYVIGNWSSLKINFTLERQAGHFFLHLYAPCILIVMLSWISFFIPKDSIAARIALGITAVLTTTTILNIQNNSMPKVSYIKLADWYLIVSFLFVFGTLVEFTVVLYLSAREKERDHKREEAKKNKAKQQAQQFGNKNFFNNECSFDGKPNVVLLLERNLRTQNNMSENEDNIEEEKSSLCENFKLDQIDEYSRICFPLSFIIFNGIYWLFFFMKKANPNS